jgi:hypothetical protein
MIDRVSIRAILVNEGEDAGAALAQAGFADPVALPVVMGDLPDLSGGMLGNGITPNLTAVLETEQDDTSDMSAGTKSASAQPAAQAQPSGPVTTTLPAAFGMQPLAPVRREGG